MEKNKIVDYTNPGSEIIKFLAIGHFTHDVTEDGLILGGAASYSSIAAQRLGMQARVVSAVGKDFLHFDKLNGISISLADDQNTIQTTTFQNIYTDGVRKQTLKGVSAPIKPEHIPAEWLNAEIVYLCPVADEVDPSIARIFPDSLIGASPQGWMRQWDDQGHVYQRKWKNAENVLPYLDALIMSEEDISSFPEVVNEYRELVKIMVLTRGERGCTLYYNGKIKDFPAFKTTLVDPTGAGDVFAVAFLRELFRTRDPYKASIFANCTASYVVEKHGIQGIPDMAQVHLRLESLKEELKVER
jgi:1D-myo-inositol 3-kinase